MRAPMCLFFAVFLLAASNALAATPTVEQLHELLLQQQSRLDALETELHQQKLLVMAQQRQLLAQRQSVDSQTQVVTVLQQRARKTEADIERVHQTLVSAAPSSQAGPMTASLEPMGAPEPAPDFPFSITTGVELLIASSDSFRFSSINMPNTANEGHSADGREFSLGYWADFSYTAPSGITWGGGLHYWSEDDTHYTNATPDQYVDITPDPFSSDKLNATLDATRFYTDLYARGILRSSGDLQLDFLAGLRGGYLGQSIYVADDATPANWVDAKATYWGVGPRVGLALDWNVWGALGVVADADVALLVGQSKARSKTDDGGMIYSNNTHILDAAWMFNTRLGLDFRSELTESSLAFELGLNVEYWSGVPDYPRYEDPLANARFDDTSMLFLGPYFSVDYKF